MAETKATVRPVRRRGARHNGELEGKVLKLSRPHQAKGGGELPIIVPGIEAPAVPVKNLTISAPDIRLITMEIEGTSPYVQHNFSEKARKIMEERMKEGTRGKNTRRVKAPRDFDKEFLEAAHVMEDGRFGIPAPAFRNAMITACSLVGFAMTKAKMSVFCLADGVDKESGVPLVAISGPEPKVKESAVRIGQTTSSVWRPMWEEWGAIVRIEYDHDQFLPEDIFNLMARSGRQVGIGEGRPASRNSAGLGWGLFRISGIGTEEKEE